MDALHRGKNSDNAATSSATAPDRPKEQAHVPSSAAPVFIAPAHGSMGGPSASNGSLENGNTPSVVPAGPRKLVRPPVLDTGPRRAFSRRGEPALLAHQALADHAIAAAGHDSSHAEVFYFQKQVQTQTLMCFVLDDGEKIEGYIEWFDRNAIKVRHSGRVLIYKSSIKYLYKSGENSR